MSGPGASGRMRFRSMDLATVLGLFSGFVLILSAMVLGGSPSSFVDMPALLIVVGGTFAVVLVSFSAPPGDVVEHPIAADEADPIFRLDRSRR